MVRDYELMYIVRPDVDDDGLRAAVDSVKSLVEGQGGEVRKTTMWGKRRLAYEVKHLRDGHYVIAELRLDGAKVANLERALRIHDTVFRHLLVVQEVPSAEGEGELVGADGVVLAASPDGESNGAAAPAAAVPAGEAESTETTEDTAEAAEVEEPEVEEPEAEAPAEEPQAEAEDTEAPAAVATEDEEA